MRVKRLMCCNRVLPTLPVVEGAGQQPEYPSRSSIRGTPPYSLSPGTPEHLSSAEQAGFWGSIMPALWSFMLAARVRGLGTALTTVHLFYEQEAAQVLVILYAHVTQAALIPTAYTLGSTFRPAFREPVEQAMHWERW